MLDQWLHFIDTEEVLPLFESKARDYTVPTVKDVDRHQYSEAVVEIVLEEKLGKLQSLTNVKEIQQIIQLLHDADKNRHIQKLYSELLDIGARNSCALSPSIILRQLLQSLPVAVVSTETLLESQLWKDNRVSMAGEAQIVFPDLLKELILSSNRLGPFVKRPFLLILQELKQLPMQRLAELVELIALSVEQPDAALDFLLDCIQPQAARLLSSTENEIEQFTRHLVGIALNHLDEVHGSGKMSNQILSLRPDGTSDGFEVVKASLRIDAPEGPPKIGDHVRFIAATRPQNAPASQPDALDAVVIRSGQGSASFRCIHHPPTYLTECDWKYRHCGSFVTSKAMLDAVTVFYVEKQACCSLYARLVPITEKSDRPVEDSSPVLCDDTLNASQNRALAAATQQRLTLLWGPPGTGKTQTIVAILRQLLVMFKKCRFLVAAPTHNAVDNILQRFIDSGGPGTLACNPLRVSTSVSRRLSSSYLTQSADALPGKER